MRHFLCVILLFSVCLSDAQEKKTIFPNKKAITFSPLALADVDHSVMFGIEYDLDNKKTIVIDAGYIFTSDYLAQQGLRGVSGLTIRPAFRLYSKRGTGYWQTQILYKLVTYKMQDWLGKNCVNDIPAYEQLQEFKLRKKVLGLNAMVGKNFSFFSDKWYLDAYFGAGVRIKFHDVVNQPNSCYSLGSGAFINIYQDNAVTPSVPLGIKIRYVL